MAQDTNPAATTVAIPDVPPATPEAVGPLPPGSAELPVDANATVAPLDGSAPVAPPLEGSRLPGSFDAISGASAQATQEGPASQSALTLMQDNESLALTKMGFNHLLESTDVIGLTVLTIMAAMSIATWYYIFYNAFRLFVVTRRTRGTMIGFWDANTPAEAKDAMEAEPHYEPFSKIALHAMEAATHHADSQGGRMAEALSRQEFIDRAIKQAATRESARFDSGLTLLATVGSTAPFVGLFGTVWGIYHALVRIGASGKASLDVVAGPVGEALIMTCIGLGVAVPSVLAYNFFIRTNNTLKGKIETFTKDLFDYFATGSRVRLTKYGARQSEPRIV